MKTKKKPPKSLYGDGSYQKSIPRCFTVDELRAALASLPGDLPLNGDNGCGVFWTNCGHVGAGGNQEHLMLRDETEF